MTLTKFRKNSPVFSPFLDNFFESDFFDNRSAGNLPSANIKEKDDRFEIELAIPGFDKSDVKIELNDGLLTISSEKKDEKEEKDGHYSRREFQYSAFSRSFRLPENVKDEDIKAQFKNGVLLVDIPKAQEIKKVKSIEIS
jgi:HSP20 family protein